jgi:hypothetical protein
MVAAVDGKFSRKAHNPLGCRSECDRMGFGDLPASLVIDRGGQVLSQRTALPDIEGLRPITDAKQGFMQVESILQEQFIYSFPGCIRRRTFGKRLLTVLLRVHIGWAAR